MIIRKLKNFAMLLAAGLLANAAFADETDADHIYSHFCEQNKDLQAMIDYYVFKNRRINFDLENLYRKFGYYRSYISNEKAMFHRLSFPLSAQYNTIVLPDFNRMDRQHREPYSFKGTPVYKITDIDSKNDLNYRLMVIPVTDDADPYNINNSLAIDACNGAKECEKELTTLYFYKNVDVILRNPDGECTLEEFNLHNDFPEYESDNPVFVNEVRLFAPNALPKVRVKTDHWETSDGKMKIDFGAKDYITIDGVKYTLVPGILRKGTHTGDYYMKNPGNKWHEYWLYMYPAGNVNSLYCKQSDKTCDRSASKIVITVTHKTGQQALEERRLVFYPKTR